MKFITLQGINRNVGTSSICASLCYCLSELDKKVLCVDADLMSKASSICALFGLDAQKSGWLDLAFGSDMSAEDDNYKIFCYQGNCYFLPKGDALSENFDPVKAAYSLFARTEKLKSLDYVLIDGGMRSQILTAELAKKSDIAITLVECTAASLLEVNSISVADNEFLLINRMIQSSSAMDQVQILYRNSSLKDCFFKDSIPFDESMIASGLNQMPLNRYLPISSPSSTIERIAFDIVAMCKNEEQSKSNRS
ncbi:MAG: cellulose synthase operon protein YhjQ/BcsQ [Succinivibrio sp.]